MSLENPKSIEKIDQTNVFDELDASNNEKSPSENLVANPESIRSKTANILLTESAEETMNPSDVVPDVVTSLGDSYTHVKTTQDKESETESTSETENSQQKVVIDDGKEQKSSDDESERNVSTDEVTIIF